MWPLRVSLLNESSNQMMNLIMIDISVHNCDVTLINTKRENRLWLVREDSFGLTKTFSGRRIVAEVKKAMERESDETQQQQVRALCRMGCGFYGSPSTENMCSKCFKDSIRRKQASPATGTLTPSQGSMEAIPQTFPDGAAAAVISPSSSTASESSNLEPASRQPEAEAIAAVPAAAASAVTETDPSEKGDKAKPKKNRCFMCRKKVGLTGFECRCGNVYCGLHRYSDKHDCTFDYKAAGRAKISKDNPVIVGSKIQKI